jgi:hypothetical protein
MIDVRTQKTHFCARLGDRTEVVDHVGLGHTNTSVADGQNFVLLVGDDADVQLLLAVKGGGVGQGSIADFVEGIRRVRDDFTKEDLFVGVESVWKT